MSTDAGLRAIWQQLENLHALKPTPSGRCRYCDAFQTSYRGQAVRALCLDCNDRRLALKERFNLFPMPADVVGTVDELEAIRRDGIDEAPRVKVEPPVEWLPYRDDAE